MAHLVSIYLGALGYTQQRERKVERRVKLANRLMVKDLMKDLEENKERRQEVIKIISKPEKKVNRSSSMQLQQMQQTQLQINRRLIEDSITI